MAFKAKVLNRVTLPQMKVRVNRAYYVKILEPIFLGEILEKSAITNPPTLAKVVNLETREHALMICNSVFAKELHKNFPNDSYVGKCFEFHLFNHENPNKRYKLVSIAEIAEPTDEDYDDLGKPTDNTPDNVDIETGEVKREMSDEEYDRVADSDFDGETPEEVVDPAARIANNADVEPEVVTRAKSKKSARTNA